MPAPDALRRVPAQAPRTPGATPAGRQGIARSASELMALSRGAGNEYHHVRISTGGPTKPWASMPLFKLRIEAADAEAGRSAAGLLGELIEPEPLAVTLFEAEPPVFTVEVYYDTPPALHGIATALAGLAGVG